MTSFWFWALVMALLTALFILWPLRKRQSSTSDVDGMQEASIEREQLVLDLFNEHLQALEQQLANGEVSEAEFQQLRQELELSLLEDVKEARKGKSSKGRAALLIMALLLPLLGLAGYLYQGNIADVQIVNLRDDFLQQRFNVSQTSSSDQQTSPDEVLQQLIAKLNVRLQIRPDNQGNRYLLARSYMQQGEYRKAVSAYMALIQVGQGDKAAKQDLPANILGELAQAIFLATGNRVTPEVQMLAQQALKKDPNESTSLGLMGIASFEQGQYQQAIDYWQKTVTQLNPSSEAALSLQAGIAQARERLLAGTADQAIGEVEGAVRGEEVPSDTSTNVINNVINVEASLAQTALDQLADFPASTTVFVYARAWQGPKMPLAIQKLTLADLPAKVVLDKSMAMAPGMDITSVPELEIVARVSASGKPVPQSGDWQGAIGPIRLSQLKEPVLLTIDQKIP